jgi:hypothetical protein
MAQATWAEAAVARPWADRAVELARDSDDPKALGEALGAKAMVAVFSGDPAGLESLFDESVRLGLQVGDLFLLAMARASSGMWRAMAGDLAGADAWITDATDAANRSGNPLAIAYTAVSRGNIVDVAGRPMDARPWYTTAIEAFERMGDRRFALIARSDLAHALRRGGAVDEAESIYRETLRDWQYAGNRGAVANQLECLAFIDIARGDVARATRLLSAAEVIREQVEAPRLGIEREEYDSALATLREQLPGDDFESAWADGRRLTSHEAIILALADHQA